MFPLCEALTLLKSLGQLPENDEKGKGRRLTERGMEKKIGGKNDRKGQERLKEIREISRKK